jgi:hypothetical protein
VFSNTSAAPALIPYGVRFASDLIFSPSTTGSDSLLSAVSAAVRHASVQGAAEAEAGAGAGAVGVSEPVSVEGVAGCVDVSDVSVDGSICNCAIAVLMLPRTRGTSTCSASLLPCTHDAITALILLSNASADSSLHSAAGASVLHCSEEGPWVGECPAVRKSIVFSSSR